MDKKKPAEMSLTPKKGQKNSKKEQMKKEQIAQNVPCRDVIFQPPLLRTRTRLSLNLVWHAASTTSLLLSKGGILYETNRLICAKSNQNWAKIGSFTN